MPIYALGDQTPNIDKSAYIHPQAVIIGAVTVGPESSIWPGAVLRGDHGMIVIGAQTSIQDGAILHCTSDLNTIVGDRCVIGHGAHLEGCTVHDDSLIGSGSVVLHRAVIGPNALVGACAMVPNGLVVPPNARALGVPATITLEVIEDGAFRASAAIYVRNVHQYASELRLLS
ncbi:MAG: gamma carbonic anhydrase family protein [Candidatus Nanopelagicales bacterium]|nr:gamma carbonic anhydrase family protein [Candidatus Nanopelagicales bacterium]